MRQVLGVGHCGFDQSSLAAVLKPFGAALAATDSATATLERLRQDAFDLVLINRVFDRDGDCGLKLIESIKADADLADVPVMLVTNFADVQQQALAAGAEPGFGKSELHSPETQQKLGRFLS